MQGFKVGIFDADIYGPSLPTLIKKEGEIIKTKEEGYRCLLPIEVNGVKCISFGFLANKPAIFRGPMASSIVSQLLLQSEWGDLDFLIVDMPPGTGDINLTVC
jgi:ATP-binding protein involved in chromosome partitioning